MNNNNTENPKAFISYSWSSPEHEEWVLKLAEELVENGVDVIIDKWNLREGGDKYAFMEKMVTDESIKKVICICDKLYAEKADGREGGVGTETQIITPELYNKVEQQKFVAVISEVDADGKPYLPTFLKNLIYIDLSNYDFRVKNFEQLIRWVFDKPLHRKPQIGKPPDYLFKDRKVLGTTSRHRQAIEALKQSKNTAPGFCQEYFDTFAENLETFRIKREVGKEFDDQVFESIEEFLPYRNECVDLFMVIVRYRPDTEMYGIIHRFLERILPYGFRPEGITSGFEEDYDNFKFILSELFIYAIASLLKNERFDGVNQLLEQEYYFQSESYDAPESRMVSYLRFNFNPSSLSNRHKRLNLNRPDPLAHMHKERATRNDLSFNDVMQTEFVLFLRSELRGSCWFPHSLRYKSLWAAPSPTPFEIFARAQSERYFNRMKIVLGINNKDKLLELINEYRSRQRDLPQWGLGLDKVDPVAFMNFDKLATKP
jgi:hypothetical protein